MGYYISNGSRFILWELVLSPHSRVWWWEHFGGSPLKISLGKSRKKRLLGTISLLTLQGEVSEQTNSAHGHFNNNVTTRRGIRESRARVLSLFSSPRWAGKEKRGKRVDGAKGPSPMDRSSTVWGDTILRINGAEARKEQERNRQFVAPQGCSRRTAAPHSFQSV